MRPSLQKNRYTLFPDQYRRPQVNDNYAILYTRKEEPVVVDLSVFDYVKGHWPYYVGNCGQIMRARRRSDKQQYQRFSIIQLSRELYGFPPQHYRVYFINGNKQDCRFENMRLVETQVSQKMERIRANSPIDRALPELQPEDYEKYIDNEQYHYLKSGLNADQVKDIRSRKLRAKDYANKHSCSEGQVHMIWAQKTYKNV